MQPWHHFVTLKPELQSGELTDGTLRLHLPEDGRAYLIEEPENGVHPPAVEAVYRSLSSAHDAQVLIATHSPVLLACTEPSELLCFSKRNGETQITRGDKHPHLADWQNVAPLPMSGVRPTRTLPAAVVR